MKTLGCVVILSFFISVFWGSAQTPFEVNVKGVGQPVLLFPGFTCTGEVWDDTVAELSKNYECL